MRNIFDNQLEKLNVELITMGSYCESAISGAVAVLFNDDSEKRLLECKEIEQKTNQKEREIEALCMRLLLEQQPVARDLRVVSSAMKMIYDMQRIGDQAADIAEISLYARNRDITHKTYIKNMARAVTEMVTKSVDSFVKNDLELAKKVIGYDDIVDGLFAKVKEQLFDIIAAENAENGAGCLDLLMIAKYFERIGDHAVNIANWVAYSITGEHLE